MNSIPHIRIGNDTITLTLEGRPFSVGVDHPNFDKISRLLAEDDPSVADLLALVDKANAIRQKFGEAEITVLNGQVFYKGTEVHNAVTSRIIEFTDKGLPTKPLILFLNNMMENPSHRAVKELYDFLDSRGMALTSDGHFLAYKGVTADFKDKHTKQIDNSVGRVVEVPRNSVDDDRDNQCSNGLHVGHYEYARSFAGRDEPVLLVKVNPRDAVSVPTDHNCGKLRTCRYEILDVYESPDQAEGNPGEELSDSLYDDSGNVMNYGGCEGCECSGSCVPDVEEGEAIEVEIEVDLSECEEMDLAQEPEDALDQLTQEYMAVYDRDNLCRLAAEQGIFPSTEAARRAGKALVAESLAKGYLEG